MDSDTPWLASWSITFYNFSFYLRIIPLLYLVSRSLFGPFLSATFTGEDVLLP